MPMKRLKTVNSNKAMTVSLQPRKTAIFTWEVIRQGLERLRHSFRSVSSSTGTVLIAKGSVDVSDLVTFMLYISVFTDPVRTLIDFTEQFQNGYTGFERFQEILAI